ncbi:ATP-dependent helicase [Chloroflexus islandicus]|uniref:ATP-dependent helicase n=1 Tax=Chloroflexus islandicus TaxID=1707952 RepID=A0A178M8N5_9CHLR|nr:helicase-related protein [Chloroflexus islandicus]OAN45151.1 ATP-dependent helicase [Chloroflexus islandicus]
MTTSAAFTPGSLVRARGREWVVLPESTPDLLVVRPLGGTDDEITGIYLPLEPVEPATFALPDPAHPGDARSCRLLRDAVRLGFRSSAGPFRSFARIAVEPRPYQLVPLLMALKLDPVRLLIADDVGIGKTIEAALVARELLDRGDAQRLAVLCPPHLAEQWQTELREKFHLEAELVLPGTAARLERRCALGQSLFEVYDHVIVSLDFIKSERRRDEFLRTCPDLVIVDEAHTCAFSLERRSGQHQRHALVKALAADRQRHLILVTATPHSGDEAAFRSLLALLDPAFADLPDDLSGPQHEAHRRRLAAHFVQRRRGDIRHYLHADTPFPQRDDREETYRLSEGYRRLFDRVLRYARETVTDPAGGNRHRQRVRWWSALALLRALASSPAAAAATLRTRAATADTETVEEADALGRRTVLDQIDDESSEGMDVIPGSDPGEDGDASPLRRRLLDLARDAEALRGAGDAKLQRAIGLVRELIDDGYRPIVFCRFIHTAEYVAAALREHLPSVTVEAVTGLLPHDEREARVLALAEHPKRVLVATDCLSEGINLQHHFNAVLHYDLSWNPTRHEQREGRVDRFGQPDPTVRVITYYGVDNQIDGIVLDVLIRKHRAIRNALGVSVPAPIDSDAVVEAIFEGLLLRGGVPAAGAQAALPGFAEAMVPQREALFRSWEAAADREKRSRTMFAQESLKPDEVARELDAARAAIGGSAEVEAFVRAAVPAFGGVVTPANGVLRIDLREAPRPLKDATGVAETLAARCTLPVADGEVYLSRTHPFVEGLASYVLESALDPLGASVARRCGAMRTRAVATRTTLLLLRLRHHVITRRAAGETAMLAEECVTVAFTGAPDRAVWLDPAAAEALLAAQPDANITPDQATQFLRRVIDHFDLLWPQLNQVAHDRAQQVLAAHRRVRDAARMRGVTYRVEPQTPPDVVGVYVLLPVAM